MRELQMFHERQLYVFYHHLDEGDYTRAAAMKAGLPYRAATWIAAEYRNRKPLTIAGLLEFERQRNADETIAVAAERAGIPYEPARVLAQLRTDRRNTKSPAT